MRHRILFITENITLAQVVRLATLARGLPATDYEVHFACSDFDPMIFEGAELERWPLYTIDKEQGFKALAKGERMYDVKTLERYVADELRVIDAVKPAVVIGDFRLSLAVSAPLRGVHCASLINAYWSPYAVRESWPVPDHPIVRLVGVERAEKYFPQALPKVFGHFAAPLNSVRKRHGLPEFETLSHQLCFGDSVLYPDIPELCGLTTDAPASHHFLGAVQWSPQVSAPLSFGADASLPLVYVTLGSSGDVAALPTVLEGLDGLPIRGVLATAGRAAPARVPSNFVTADYVPGELLAAQALFVVTNGGSSTGYQALAQGVPVLGIPSNLDQYLAMAAITGAGAGLTLRSGGLTRDQVRKAAVRLLDAPPVKRAAEGLARHFAAYDCHERFGNWLSNLLPGSPG
ncbi:MAG TPA: nucleotide disphospho-sugar-binding domain-containing protein [Polyangiaceae bacterium]|nr:nucleotide disphospho-sugar-binding domain-containing protein [Polyangiaceae bacterium]